MIKIIIAVALLCCAVFFGPRLADSQGFVHIATEGYIVETSLTTAIIIALVSFLVLHVIVNLINGTIRLPKSTARYFGRRKDAKQHNLHNEAFLAYEEGSYTRALALLKKTGPRSDLPTSCLFLGAKCAFKTGDLNACREFLDLAQAAQNSSEVACKLLRARLNLGIGNHAAALENLESVKNHTASSALATKLLYECYDKAEDFEQVHKLLPSLKKLKIVNEDEARAITKRCATKLLETADSAEKVNAVVASLDRQERTDAAIMAPIVSKLVAFDELDSASKLTLDVLHHSSDAEFLNSIAKWHVAIPEVLKELSAQAKRNAIGSSTNVPLLKALANLELKSDMLAEAKEHLKQALEVTKSRDLYLLAAELNERLSRYDEATKFFALALKDAK